MIYDDRVPPEWLRQIDSPITALPGPVPAVTTELLPPPVLDNSVGAPTPLLPHSDAVKLEHARQAQENYNRRRAVAMNQSLSPHRVTAQGLSAPLKALVDSTVKGQIVEDKVKNNSQLASLLNNTFLPQLNKETAIRDITKNAIQQVEVAQKQILQPAPNPPPVEQSILPPLEQNFDIAETQAFNEKFGSARSNLDSSFDPETYGLISEQPGSILPKIAIPERSVAQPVSAEPELEAQPVSAETIEPELEAVSAETIEPEPEPQPVSAETEFEFMPNLLTDAEKPNFEASLNEGKPVLSSVKPSRDGSEVVPTTKPVPLAKTGNKTLDLVDKQMHTELARLVEKPPKDSTMPFWNWLADFSAGMRAAAKGGDQTFGAIAAGFENVRKGAKERTATKLAQRKITIENIKDLGEVREDIAAADALGNVGASATAKYATWLSPGQTVGPNGIAPQGYVTALGYSPWKTTISYSTNKAGQVIETVHTRDLTKDKKVRFWKRGADKLPNPKNYKDISPSDKQFGTFTKSPEWTSISPGETSRILTPAEIRNHPQLSKNKKALNRILDSGALIKVQMNENGTEKEWAIVNPPDARLVPYYSRRLKYVVTLDEKNPEDLAKIKTHKLTKLTELKGELGPTAYQEALEKVKWGQQGIDMINQIRSIAGEDGGKEILGSIARLKRKGQNALEFIKVLGKSFLPLDGLASEITQDFSAPDSDPNVEMWWYDPTLDAADILHNSLVYKYAKLLKGSRLNTDDINNAKTTLGAKGWFNTNLTMLSRLKAIEPLFKSSVDASTQSLSRLRQGMDELEDDLSDTTRPRYTPTADSIKKIRENYNNPVLKKFFIRKFGQAAYDAARPE